MNKKYIVYTITFQGNVMYVGKTCKFTIRKWQHLNKIGTNYSAIPDGFDLDKVSFNIVGEYENDIDALKEEDRLIVEYQTITNGWNKLRSGHIRIDNNTEYTKKHSQSYRENNRESYNAYMRARHKELMKDPVFREKERERSKKYRKQKKQGCIPCL